MHTPILIPAFRPGAALPSLVEKLLEAGVPAVVIVDDGSGPGSREIFERCAALAGVHILRHETNLGKGAALKTGLRYILEVFPGCGVVTADADGQHAPEDIIQVARALEQNPGCLVLGCRHFDQHVPVRSRIGNLCTRALARVILGEVVQDTQTGLRGLPAKLLPYLPELSSNGYEFELDVLIASKHLGLGIREEKIQTIYAPGNPTSHFNPLRDSMKIYFVLFRFSLLSLLTAALDNLVFFFAYRTTASVLAAQAMSRSVAVLFNYTAARRAVFLSHQRHKIVFPKYILVVVASGAASYGLIRLLMYLFAIPPMLAKLSAESLLFAASFVLQRDFVFTQRLHAAATDWTRYYRSAPFTARFTRMYTARVLVAALAKFRQQARGGVIVELGGGNSCFLDRIVGELRPEAYHVVDNNDYGLQMLSQRPDKPPQVRVHREDVLNVKLDLRADAVFSVGLIEHFDRAGTKQAVLKHFELLAPGGYAVLSFPTPTALYRVARRLTEWLGLWSFPDERPLEPREVRESVAPYGEVVLEKTLWPLVYTQHLMVVRKRELDPATAVSA
ncbi:MAG TPA: glycosyltransferase [Bryobacteraceae bacterium]|nr:glycosyltransferase [Bryobacteraceae bacterium]